MEVFVNNTGKIISEQSSLSTLIESLELSPKGIAIAIGNKVVPKTLWENTLLHAGDKITIIKATQGG